VPTPPRRPGRAATPGGAAGRPGLAETRRPRGAAGRVRAGMAIAAAAAAAGLALAAYGIARPARVTPPAPASSTSATTPAVTAPPFLSSAARSAPVSIRIPAIGVSSKLGPSRGLNPDGTVNDAPLSGSVWSLPWWYDRGSSPGQAGSAVILGHVDSAVGAGHLGVFFRLGDVKPGDAIFVTLQDGAASNWVVLSTVLYPDQNFPDGVVYAHTGPPRLRLVTCGGNFDSATHSYESAVVVTAALSPNG